MAEYDLNLRQATREFPLPAALALIAARASRLGHNTGPGHADRAYAAARNRAMAWLRSRYRITPTQPRGSQHPHGGSPPAAQAAMLPADT